MSSLFAPPSDGGSGQQFYILAGAPSNGLGSNGDVYLDKTSAGKDLYKKVAGVWVLQCSLSGGSLTIRDEGSVIETGVTEIDVTGVDINVYKTAAGKVKLNSPPATQPFGYFSGGNFSSVPVLITSRLDFSNDSAAMLAKGALNTGRVAVGAVNSSLNGYWGGGVGIAGAALSKMDFTNDASAMTATSSFIGGLFDGVLYGAVNSALKGYFAGMSTGNTTATSTTACQALDFASDAAAMTSKGALTLARGAAAGFNSSTFGYFVGGTDTGGASTQNTDRLDFASDASAMLAKGALANARSFLTGLNSLVVGYVNGADTSNANQGMQSLAFATDSLAFLNLGNLESTRSLEMGANSLTFGYFAGGNNPSLESSVCKRLDFAADSLAMVTVGALTTARQGGAGCQSGGIL